MKNAHAFPDIYKRLGIDLRDLGCLMLDTENPLWELSGGEPYVSPDPKKFWVNGIADSWHTTLRYGFLSGVTRDDVDAVLTSGVVIPTRVYSFTTDIFPSPYPDEEYDCLVLRLRTTDLLPVNQALSVLPNVNTFPEYKPHITIGYFKKGRTPTVIAKSEIATTGLDYGQNLPRLTA